MKIPGATSITLTVPVMSGDRRPARIVDLELSLAIEDVPAFDSDGCGYRDAWFIVRIFDEAVGMVTMGFPDGAAALMANAIADAVRFECGDVIAARVAEAGGDVDSALAGLGTSHTREPAFLAAHARWASDGPDITVAICTRNRPADLMRALDSLREQSYPRFRVVVVDNAPPDDATRAAVTSRPASERITYVSESRPGLSWARNCALDIITTPVVAWLDDDEVADRHWLMETAAAFCLDPAAAAVSGVVVPAELRTMPQLWFEEFGGHSKGRGFTGAHFSQRDGGQDPLYPLPPFGVGANMAFDTAQLRAVGGFDTALGAGTLTQGGEDTLVFSQLLLAGGTIVYRPTSLTRHYHRPDYDSLARQMRGYGTGLTAYYSSLVRSDWRLLVRLLRLAPQALRDVSRGGEARAVPDSFPKELLGVKTRGMAQGPWLYARARRAARRLGRP